MKRAIAALIALAAFTACSDSASSDGYGRWVLVEYDGRKLPTTYMTLPSYSESILADTLDIRILTGEASHTSHLTYRGQTVRVVQSLEVVPNDNGVGFGLDFHCSYPGACALILAPAPAEMRGDTLYIAKNTWNVSRSYVRR